MNLLEHAGNVFRGLGNKDEVVDKNEVGKDIRGNGEASLGVLPFSLEVLEKLLDG